MNLPKFLLADNSQFPEDIFVLHTEFPRFVINLKDDEIEWCSKKIDDVAREMFAAIDVDDVLAKPIFYSTWLSKDSYRVTRDELKTSLLLVSRSFMKKNLMSHLLSSTKSWIMC